MASARIPKLAILSLALAAVTALAAEVRVPANSAAIRYMGRVVPGVSGAPLIWSGTSASIAFSGTGCRVVLQSPGSWYRVEVDGRETKTLSPASATDTLHVLASGLPAGPHVVTLSKRTEVSSGKGNLVAFLVDGTVGIPAAGPDRRIEFVGNSITCGYGALDSVKEHGFSPATEDHGVTYAALAARALGAEHHAICWSGRGLYRNNTGDTAGTMPRLWPLTDPDKPGDAWSFVVVVDLGTNDFAKAPAPDSADFVNAGVRFIAAIRAKYPAVPVVLADGPMLSDSYPSDASGKPIPTMTLVRKYNQAIAAKAAGGGVTVLSLSPQTGELGYGADWHPNVRQHQKNSLELIAHLKSVTGWSETVGLGRSAGEAGKAGKAGGKGVQRRSPQDGAAVLWHADWAGAFLDMLGRWRGEPRQRGEKASPLR